MTIAILLAAKDGANYLEQQLQSLRDQTVDGADVFVAEDGSTDDTPGILKRWAALWDKGRFEIGPGPGTGSAADAFRHLVLTAPVDHDHVAFADQDDIWLPEKLRAASTRLASHADQPAVYCSRTKLIDAAGTTIGNSRIFRKPPAFRNALVQSIAGGNTMVMNRAAFAVLKESMRRGPVVAHDWWTYQIVTGAGGSMLYQREPDTLYRQHASNVVGSNIGPVAALRRVNMVLKGRMRRWNDANIASLEQCRDLLTDDAIDALNEFSAARRGDVLNRLQHLAKAKVYRQTVRGRLSLWGACLLKLL